MSGNKRLMVIHLLDGLTAGPPQDQQIQVTAEGVLQRSLRKANGMVVFKDLESDRYRVRVSSERYFDETMDVDLNQLDPAYPVTLVALRHRPSYPFRSGVTLIRASVRDESGRPLAGVQIRAVVVSESCAKGKLSQDSVAGAQEVALIRVAGRIEPGQRYFLCEAGGNAGETVVIKEAAETARAYSLVDSLTGEHKRGAWLMPCVESESDARGEVVLPFGNCRAAAWDVRVEFSYLGRTLLKEVRVEAGQTTVLGVVHVTA